MKKAATDAICGGFTPPLLQTTRGAAVQSTEKKTISSLTIRGIERDIERTPSDRGGIIRHEPGTKGWGGSGTPGDNLLADWRELEAALAAERDRADQAEARIADALSVLRTASIPLGVTELLFKDSLIREARRVLSSPGDAA